MVGRFGGEVAIRSPWEFRKPGTKCWGAKPCYSLPNLWWRWRFSLSRWNLPRLMETNWSQQKHLCHEPFTLFETPGGLIHQILLRWSSSIFRWVTFEREDPHHGLQVEACASSSVNHLAIWQTGVTSNAWPNQTTCLKSLRVNCRHRISKEFCWAFNSHDVHFFGGTKIFLVFVAMRLLLHTRFLSKVH